MPYRTWKEWDASCQRKHGMSSKAWRSLQFKRYWGYSYRTYLNAKSKARHGCSLKVWKRARKLSVSYFGQNLFLVTGGRDPHRVYFGKQKICDCLGGHESYNGRCSHIQAVRNFIERAIEQKQ